MTTTKLTSVPSFLQRLVGIWVELEQYLALHTVGFHHYILRFQGFQYYQCSDIVRRSQIFKKSPTLFKNCLVMSNEVGDFFNFLWPSQKFITLFILWVTRFEGKTHKNWHPPSIIYICNQKIYLLFFCLIDCKISSKVIPIYDENENTHWILVAIKRCNKKLQQAIVWSAMTCHQTF